METLLTHEQNEDGTVDCQMPDLSSWDLSDMEAANKTLKGDMEAVLAADNPESTISNFEYGSGDGQLPNDSTHR